MRILVQAGGPPVLLEPDDFERFCVVMPMRPAEEAERLSLLRAVGEPEGDGHVWVGTLGLKALGALHGGPDWPEGFSRMAEYAAAKGWTRAGDGAIRAHIEYEAA